MLSHTFNPSIHDAEAGEFCSRQDPVSKTYLKAKMSFVTSLTPLPILPSLYLLLLTSWHRPAVQAHMPKDQNV